MQINNVDNQPNFGMATKKLKSFNHLGHYARQAYRVAKDDMGQICDITVFKKKNHQILSIKATPKNIIGMNNQISRFFYDLLGKSAVACVGAPTRFNKGRSLKDSKGTFYHLEEMAVASLAKKTHNKKLLLNLENLKKERAKTKA